MINNKRNKFKISKSLKIKINKILKENNLQTNCDDFFDNARKSIQYREYAKFVFSKSINEIFVNLINLGKEVKILRKDLDYLSIKNIMNFYSNVNVKKLKKLLKEEIVSNKREQKILKLLNVPEFISQEKDLYLQKERVKEGSFVTNKSIIASILNFKKIKKFNLLKGKIILLDNADPGYDFIFSHNIKGLVTRYGGANSHMSIRSLELGVPAIIGVGPKDFETLINANTVEINCEQKFLDYKLMKNIIISPKIILDKNNQINFSLEKNWIDYFYSKNINLISIYQSPIKVGKLKSLKPAGLILHGGNDIYFNKR